MKRRKHFNKAEYQSLGKEYEKKWKTSDEVLYGLCKEFPDHKDQGGVNAKLLVIGRSYNTGIERQIKAIKSKGTRGSSMEQLAEHIWKNHHKVNGIFENLSTVKEPLCESNLKTIVQAHKELCQLVQRLRTIRGTPRSFVSKYLHFHYPAVPIYDTVAASRLGEIIPWKAADAAFLPPERSDKDYRCFVALFWQFYQDTQKEVAVVSVKLLDNYLWHRSEKAAPL
jgi:hypothetical protein